MNSPRRLGPLRGQPTAPSHLEWLRAFWNRAYKENITGLAGMVAYNLMLAIFPFALLVLFIFGQIVDSPEIEESVIADIQRLFPNIEQGTLENAIDRVRSSSTTIGVAAAVGGLWIGASFWGAMDTAFCRIYHVECRGWVEQKRFAFVMLAALTLLLAASVAVPAVESAALSQAEDLPVGPGRVRRGSHRDRRRRRLLHHLRDRLGDLLGGAEGPHALALGLARGALLQRRGQHRQLRLPLLPDQRLRPEPVGGTIGFILVALLWFYAVSLGLLAGAVINSLRHERDDTGTFPTDG